MEGATAVIFNLSPVNGAMSISITADPSSKALGYRKIRDSSTVEIVLSPAKAGSKSFSMRTQH
jgi:hypothetical protein